MAINLNQTAMGPIVGSYAIAPFKPALQARVASTQATAIGAGAIVKLVANTLGSTPVVAPAGVSDTPCGVVAYCPIKEGYSANEMVSLATEGDVVYLETTAAAIVAGSKVEYNANGKVLTSAGTNSVLGIALDSVGATGGVIRVKITAPFVAM